MVLPPWTKHSLKESLGIENNIISDSKEKIIKIFSSSSSFLLIMWVVECLLVFLLLNEIGFMVLGSQVNYEKHFRAGWSAGKLGLNAVMCNLKRGGKRGSVCS